MNEHFNAETAMYGHTDEASAYVVDDYPYGFRLRTTIRYWIETTKRGDRFVSQTRNPKVAGEVWNKPKKSTYSEVMVMFLNEEGHVTYCSVNSYTSSEDLEAFRTITEGHLSDAQKRQLAVLFGIRKVMQNVKFTVREGAMTEEEKAEQAEAAKQINQAIAVEATIARRDLG